MEVADQPNKNFSDDPNVILRPRPWLQKFKVWKTLVKGGCPASAGPGGFLCSWIGGNCSFNNCPRRNFEEDELINESVLKVEKFQVANKKLKQDNAAKAQQIKALKLKLG